LVERDLTVNGDTKKSIDWRDSCIDGKRVALYRKMAIETFILALNYLHGYLKRFLSEMKATSLIGCTIQSSRPAATQDMSFATIYCYIV